MNLFTVLLVYILNFRNEVNFCKVRKAYFLKNKFWCTDQVQPKTDRVYLYKVDINVKHNSDFINDSFYYSETCHFLKATNFGYILEDYWMFKYIVNFIKSSEDVNFFIKLNFLFTDEPIDNNNDYKLFKGRKQEYETYKLLERNPEKKNSLRLKSDGIDICMELMKNRLNELIWMKLFKLNDYIKNIGEIKLKYELGKIENVTNFNSKLNFYYFENFSECLENLKELSNNLCYFKLLNDGVFYSFAAMFFDVSVDNKTTLKVSQFKKHLYKIFYDNLKKSYGFDKTWEELFDLCFKYLKDEMLNNNIFLHIGGKCDIYYYIRQLSNLIYETTKKFIFSDSRSENFFYSEITDTLRLGLKNLQVKNVKYLCESKYVYKHFSNLLGRKIKTLDDNIEIEKMICDYNNMLLYILNLFNGLTKDFRISYPFCSPILFDNYDLMIIDGIKINFNSSIKFLRIRGFDKEEKEMIFEENNEYFINEFNSLCCPSDVLKMKNIYEIEVILLGDNYGSKKFKINEYLNI